MTDAEKKAKGLKTGKNIALYPDQIKHIHKQAIQPDIDVSDSEYVEALIRADIKSGGKLGKKAVEEYKTEQD